ncbi:hypothetical protein Slin15195_G093100 [Septoria linicola]|uniref:SnoaL-like domain-containing protein n=1 Tax=Septoria linicola TaxID=215465 RepID=A0A9Q9B456_9PEZI|nr:hypothetical protein Slin14017_G056210 [Septoria linicola]USW55991.1 hypothetical protein Slin15195_G093100 [Septoria linicola]
MPDPIQETLVRWEQTVLKIKAILRGLVEALNTDTCTPDNPLVSEAYDADFAADKSPYFYQKSAKTLQEYIAGMNELVKSNPGFFVNIISIDVNYLDETHAEAMSQIEIHNAPAGTRRQVMGIFRFHLKEDKWLCFTTEAISGFDAEERPGFAPGV